MAERRMFAKSIIDSDLFLDMPSSTQNLYFHLAMRADDDGFVNSPQKIMRTVSCSKNDMDMLVFKQFVIPFESGICVIKHWKIHNYLRNDRYKPTIYIDEKNQLGLDESKSYTVGTPLGIPHAIPVGDAGKVSIGKVRLGECSDEETDTLPLEDFEKVRRAYVEIHGSLDMPYSNAPLLTKLLADGIPADLIIGIMVEKYKPSVKTLKFYEAAIREAIDVSPANKSRGFHKQAARQEPNYAMQELTAEELSRLPRG